MTDYTRIIPHILEFETGSPNGWSVKAVPGDPGGLTVSGLTWGTYQQLAYKLLGIMPTIENFEALTKPQWMVFVKYFWDKFTLDGQIASQAISEMVVDFAWGSKYAVRQIQRMLNTQFGKNLVADNVMGPKTISALNSIPEKELFSALARTREDYYKTLDNYPTNKDGWERRVTALYNEWLGKVTNIVYAADKYANDNPGKTIVGFFLLRVF